MATGGLTRQLRLGLTLIIGGAVVNPWTAGLLLTDDGTVDSAAIAAAIMFFTAASVLAGLQLTTRWIDAIAWTQPVRSLTAAAVVLAMAGLAAGTYWRIASYAVGHSHTTIVAAGPQQVTAEQEQWAESFYRRALAAALANGWFDYDKALAQGFEVDRVNHTHYPNQKYLFDDVLLDPERPEWLIYYDSPEGKTLMGFMFFTRSLEEVGPTPGGSLAEWHFHPYDEPRCAIQRIWTVARPDENGECAEGVPVTRTPEMFHVWFIDHPLGRFTDMNVVSDRWTEADTGLQTVHPIVIHFAIVLFALAVLLDGAGMVTRNRQYHWAAWVNLCLAAVAVTAAVATGMGDELRLKPTHAAHQTLDTHKLFAWSSLAIVALAWAWRYGTRGRFPVRGAAAYVALSLAGVGAIGAAGYYGGEMVYRHGAGVTLIDQFARERYWETVRTVYRADPEEAAARVRSQPAAAPRASGHTGHH
jgi:uncharacterized membrane protein